MFGARHVGVKILAVVARALKQTSALVLCDEGECGARALCNAGVNALVVEN
jgi:hypothetical protein